MVHMVNMAFDSDPYDNPASSAVVFHKADSSLDVGGGVGVYVLH